MISFARMFQAVLGSLLLIAAALPFSPAFADDGFPFGTEMQLDVNRQPGSKRIPNLEIGDAGEVVLELWCKGGKGQFSVAGNTVIFVAGAMENRSCPPDRAQAGRDGSQGLRIVAQQCSQAIECPPPRNTVPSTRSCTGLCAERVARIGIAQEHFARVIPREAEEAPSLRLKMSRLRST